MWLPPPRLGELPIADATLAGAFWSRDGRTLFVPKSGDLWQVPLDGGAASAVWTTEQVESSIAASPDGSRVAFVAGAAANWWCGR